MLRERPASFELEEAAAARLHARLEAAVVRARSTGEGVLAAVTLAVPGAVDPSAVAVAGRDGGEPWFCLEQPDRDGAVLAGLGCATALEEHGPERFARVARRWSALAAAALCDAPDAGPGSGLVAVGGFAFAHEGGASRHWRGFAPASLHVPEIALARRGGELRLTVAALVGTRDDAGALLAQLQARLAALDPASALPLWDPDPVGTFSVESAMPPEHYEGAVARGVERIRAGALDKIVLAREVQVHAPADHDPGAILGILRDGFPSCFVFCVGRGDSTFLAASPELLIRREGMRATTLALAGSAGRSADPAVDAHLGERLLRSGKDREEHAIVVRRLARALREHAVWVAESPEPVVVKVANIQHLATPIRAQLSRPVPAVRLAGLLHPTPAVGGEPWAVASPLIPELEGLDRGWYAGPVGWTDTNEDGEFCVALRSGLLCGPVARLYAGVGVVRDSDPAAELTETEVKLRALLPVLGADRP
jgi:salicylate biosynthesis isochorismate synthase/menaquinone-specific isochorismate synthase